MKFIEEFFAWIEHFFHHVSITGSAPQVPTVPGPPTTLPVHPIPPGTVISPAPIAPVTFDADGWSPDGYSAPDAHGFVKVKAVEALRAEIQAATPDYFTPAANSAGLAHYWLAPGALPLIADPALRADCAWECSQVRFFLAGGFMSTPTSKFEPGYIVAHPLLNGKVWDARGDWLGADYTAVSDYGPDIAPTGQAIADAQRAIWTAWQHRIPASGPFSPAP